MGQISISITKRVSFRDWTQEFSNVYTYTSTAANPSESGGLALIDELAAFEKTIHSTDVGFILGRIWSSGGSVASNAMIAEETLTGSGATTPSTSMDRERAVLIQWPAGFDSRGHPVRLKKWYHTCGIMAGVNPSNNVLKGVSGFTTAERNAMANVVGTNVSQIGPSNQWILSAVSGRQFEDAAICHRYLEHHQLGDQWR